MDTIESESTAPKQNEPTRRDFLHIVTGSFGLVGAASVAWPLLDQMNPDAVALTAGAPVDINIAPLAPGQQMIVKWRGLPMFISRRTTDQLETLRDPKVTSELLDPACAIYQQPDYARNWSRSVKPEIGVLVGVCTHLGCLPEFDGSKGELGPSWPGGYFCPCHGSKYDLSGRVYRGVPAPYNLPVPPYHFVNDSTLRIGENPEGSTFDLSSVAQI